MIKHTTLRCKSFLAAARVWREGQKKRTYVYRFLATGTIEEKIYQRQLSKEGLQSVVADELNMESSFSTKDLKDLFTLREDTVSDTHDKYRCDRCVHVEYSLEDVENSDVANIQRDKPQAPSQSKGRFSAKLNVRKRTNKQIVLPPRPKPNAEQLGFPSEGDINDWSHHNGSESVDDDILRRAGRGLVTFCYGQVIGMCTALFSTFSRLLVIFRNVDGEQMTESDLNPAPKPKRESSKPKTEPQPASSESECCTASPIAPSMSPAISNQPRIEDDDDFLEIEKIGREEPSPKDEGSKEQKGIPGQPISYDLEAFKNKSSRSPGGKRQLANLVVPFEPKATKKVRFAEPAVEEASPKTFAEWVSNW